jgi:predicted PurR-regulated permease PerM
MKVSTDMLLAGVPGQKLAVLVAGIIRCTRHTGIHRSDTVQLIKSGTIQMVKAMKIRGRFAQSRYRANRRTRIVSFTDEYLILDSRNQQEVHNMEKRFENFAQLAAVFILVAGCFLVLRPFMAAMLLALVVCVSTWPLYLWLLRRMKGRQNIAALTMTLSLALAVILPLALVAYNLADNVTSFYDEIRQVIDAGPPEPPAWLKGMPVVGERVDAYWRLLATDQDQLVALENRLLEPAKNFLLAGGILLGQGFMVMSLAAFVSFFFYRDGVALVRFLNVAMDRVVGTHAENILGIISNTVRSVMFGVMGGVLVFGFVGVFIGPTLLAVGLSRIQEWAASDSAG